MQKGKVTIPTAADFVEGTREIAKKWGADAVRDCDGTELPREAASLAEKVYNTYFVVRGDNQWADLHENELQNVLLMSERTTALDSTLTIDLLRGYYRMQLEVNPENPKKYWQVFDRTTGEEVLDWEYDGRGRVTIPNARAYHEYTVNFFAKNIWDSTQMYNYIKTTAGRAKGTRSWSRDMTGRLRISGKISSAGAGKTRMSTWSDSRRFSITSFSYSMRRERKSMSTGSATP